MCERRRGSRRGVREGACIARGCYYATALDIEVDPQRCCLGSCQADFACRKRRRKNSPLHSAAGGDYSGEKRKVLIVSVLLLIGGDLAAQQYAAARPNPEGATGTRSAARGWTTQTCHVRCLGRRRDSGSRPVEKVPELHIAAPLTRAGRHAMLSPYRVSGRAEQRPQYGHHPVVRLGCT